MAAPVAPAALSRGALRTWRKRLLHDDWRLWDLEFFHVLAAAVSVVTVLLAAVLVVAMTRADGSVRVSVGFVAVLVAAFVVVRGATRSGLAAAERRVAAIAAAEARFVLLDAIGRGASVAPGAAATFATRSADQIGTYVARTVPARATALVIAVAVLAVEALVDPWSALIAGGVVVVVPFVLATVGRRASREAATSLARLRSLGTRALELLDGAVELRALGAIPRGREELGAATDRVVASTRDSLRVALWSATSLDVLAGAAVGLVAMANGFRLLNGSMPLGDALAAVLLTVEVFVPLRAAGAAFHDGADGQAALVVLDAAERGAATTDVLEPPEVESAALAAEPPAVRAEDLALRAAPDGPVVTTALSFTVPARSALVVRGATGSGKSTLLRAIAGVPLVAAGTLRLGATEPSALTWRQRARLVALVDQRPFLVAGTIRDNLELGASASPSAIDDVVSRCGLAPLLARSPLGLREQVGEEGRLLSAGERTRIALARAVLREPRILLLDEVGAHLDDRALDELRAGLGLFLAARTVVEAAHDRPLLDMAPTVELSARADVQ